MKRARILVAGALMFVMGCGDDPFGIFPAGAEPDGLRIQLERAEVTEGESVAIGFQIIDRRGDVIEQLPHWLEPVWSVSGPAPWSIADGRLDAADAALGRVHLDVGRLTASVPLRVNATSVTMRVDGVQLNQSVQRYDGTVPLVRNRAGVLRVFVAAVEPNRIAPPPARIELFLNGVPVHAETVESELSDIPVSPSEGSLSHSWNLMVPAELAQPGLAVRVEVDPDRTIPLRLDGPVYYPTSGEALELNIQSVPDFRVRFVPIYQSHFGSTGDVGEHNVQRYLDDFAAAFPIDGIDYDFRTTYTTSRASGDSTNWRTILPELRAVRAAEAHDDRHYYGVLKNHNSSIAGIAYVPGSTALGIDHFPFATYVFAHELGHNFGRYHAPCGLSSFDQNYPHPGGRIGHYGYDARTGRLVPDAIADLMGYCQPTWVSDYTYQGIFDFRRHNPVPVGSTAARTSTLVVWGGIRNGMPYLEPAFEAATIPSRPSGGGPLRLEGVDADGQVIFSFSVRPEEIAHSEGGDAADFAFALPLKEIGYDRLARIRLTGPGGTDELRLHDTSAPGGLRAPGVPTPLEARMTRRADGSVLSWDASRSHLAVVRDRASGEIISLARGGEVRLPAHVGPVDVDLSLGTRSVRARVVSQ
jgi:hypothetical protein